MPELPEVETTVKGLRPYLSGKKIIHAELRRSDLRWPVPKELLPTLRGATVEVISRRAKYMLLALDNGHTMICHLGMSGSFRMEAGKPNQLKRHDHFLLQTEEGHWAIYHDPRRFGALLLCHTEALPAHPLLRELGVEPLTDALCGAYLHASFQKRQIAVKNAIMTPAIVVGVGNIYASEALFAAGIHPLRPACEVELQRCDLLAQAIKQVLQAAIASGGSTLRDYLHGGGETGYFQHHFRVYNKAGQACEKCNDEIRKQVIAGRSSFFCSKCQG